MKLRANELLSFDGVMERVDQWFFQFVDPQIDKAVMQALSEVSAMLFGRTTYVEMAEAWPNRSGHMADIFNSVPKYVVSSTLTDVSRWNNSHLIKDKIVEEVTKLKAQPGNVLLLQGSADLFRLLAQNNLIDEYDFHIAPLVVGKGKRLFEEGNQLQLKLVETKAYKTGVLSVSYEPAK